MKKVTVFLVIIFAIAISIQYWWALSLVAGISLTIFGIIRAKKDKQRKSRQSIYQVDKHGQQPSIGKDISLHGGSDESQDIDDEDTELKNAEPHHSHRDKLNNSVTSDKSVNSNLNKPTSIEEEKSTMRASTRQAPNIHKLRRKLTNFVVVDIETTGFNRFEETIIQISALKFKKDQLNDDFNCYINPHRKLQQKISSLTGLTDEKLKNAPDLNYALDKFTHFVADFPLVGHNIMGFDLPFLIEKGFYLPDIEALDTLPLSRRKLPELKDKKLPTLKKYFGVVNRSHNALNDCRTTAIVYQRLRDDKLDEVEPDYSKIPKSIAGIRFCITGKFDEESRDDLIDEIKQHGGRYTKSVSGLTNYLLKGTQTSQNLIDGVHSNSELKMLENVKNGKEAKIIGLSEFHTLIATGNAKQ
ncbi:exonuclease domain-containing protein [Lactiplantibacillus pentosus]|uniref:exonuclease domain-containing protein n=1 Tax=Lactiplantibacillus pentosus TaxID=1589 RepID=UPI001C200079|nr:exonuclease domain-containing protein [Lactiplantibacillus pentosus]MBU7529491.1 hypothetical protein [Lactiplantibacillus pentosus]